MKYLKYVGALLFAFIVYTFLYLPILVTILFSFNESKVQVLPIKKLTFDWYRGLFSNTELWVAAKNSLLVSLPATLCAIVFGTLAAYLFQRYRIRGGSFLQFLILLPYILPGIIIGTSLNLLFKFLQVDASLMTVIIGHITFITPVVMFLVMDRLKRFDRNLEFASMDLGASPMRTFLLITLPNIRSAVLAGALLGLTISFDEVIVSFFLIGTDNTLPMLIWSMIRHGYSPQINAVYTLIVLFSLGLIAIAGSRLFAQRNSKAITEE
ncbi:ABC transporter permease [Paenibacillus sabinae]|uniref:Binding-protein-dependent transport system inner membrane protein n=1 Tax=Paenibacillus sabinae T27 TaxID=1268072 RepID=X4ZHF0_9BACL|nr:ABC transporter permease [Paenibacillus sabinae]AHV98931.1 binding-protein-dependent transport system inner membrane protein [Paenibacillus sabinae T27]